MSHETVAGTALGARADLLDESVTLATPLTLGRLVGRERAATTMRHRAMLAGLLEE